MVSCSSGDCSWGWVRGDGSAPDRPGDRRAFYVKAVAPSQLYLNPPLATKIHVIYERSWELYRLIELAESGGKPGMSKWDHINAFQDLGRTELEEVIRAVTREIHVGTS